jgi:hypothetical protein
MPRKCAACSMVMISRDRLTIDPLAWDFSGAFGIFDPHPTAGPARTTRLCLAMADSPTSSTGQNSSQTDAANAAGAAAAAAASTGASPASTKNDSRTTKPDATSTQAAPAAGAKPAADAATATGETKPAAGEAKPADGETKPAATDPAKKPDAAAAADAVPEAYAITPPKGVELDTGFLTALTPAMKAAGLTQAKAQSLAEAFIAYQGGMAARIMERDLKVVQKDAELGGLNYGRTQTLVNLARNAFGDPEFEAFVTQAGIANRLEFVRVFERIGRAMASDTAVRGSPRSAEPASTADKMYGGRDLVTSSKAS